MELLNDYRIGSPVVALFISAALVAALIVRLTLNYFTPGLSQYPGDFLGKCTDGWRLWKTYKSKQWPWISSMLKKYNTNAVRVGPSTIYISDISVLDEIYSFKDNYVKVCPLRPFSVLVIIVDFHRRVAISRHGRKSSMARLSTQQ